MTTEYIIIAAGLLIVAYFFLKLKSGDNSFSKVSVNDLSQLMKDKNTVLIDVRTKNEIKQGKIGKPLEIELGPTLTSKMANLDKSKKYIVYCRSGNRSAQACKMMVKMGFEDVNNLSGGFSKWRS